MCSPFLLDVGAKSIESTETRYSFLHSCFERYVSTVEMTFLNQNRRFGIKKSSKVSAEQVLQICLNLRATETNMCGDEHRCLLYTNAYKQLQVTIQILRTIKQ